MARDFILLMVGLVMALISINVNGVDLLPDFIGYGLIAFAAHSLGQYAGKFHLSRNLALPLVILSLIADLGPWPVAQTFFFVNTALTIPLVWYLLGAVMQFVEKRERPDLAGQALKYRRVYLAIAVFALFIQLAAQFRPTEAAGFASILGLATAVILAFIIRLLYIVRHDLAVDMNA